MKQIKSLRIKSLLLTLLPSLIIVFTGANVKIEAEGIHDINCKFSCEHIYIPSNSDEVSFISDEAEVLDIIGEKVREILKNEHAELTDEEIDKKVQEILGNIVDLADSGIPEILQNNAEVFYVDEKLRETLQNENECEYAELTFEKLQEILQNN